MLNLKIKEPDYKALYESRQAKIDSLNKTISGLKARNTKLENEIKTLTKPKNSIKERAKKVPLRIKIRVAIKMFFLKLFK
jgi:cell division protein FtsB